MAWGEVRVGSEVRGREGVAWVAWGGGGVRGEREGEDVAWHGVVVGSRGLA